MTHLYAVLKSIADGFEDTSRQPDSVNISTQDSVVQPPISSHYSFTLRDGVSRRRSNAQAPHAPGAIANNESTRPLSPAAAPSANPQVDAAPRSEEIRRAVGLGEEDYTRKYPEDEYGTEMGPDARVWRTYISERDIADKEYIDDTNGTLEGILVFVSTCTF